jgi:hypothetical protein
MTILRKVIDPFDDIWIKRKIFQFTAENIMLYTVATSQARVFILPRTTPKTLVGAGHVGLQEFIA